MVMSCSAEEGDGVCSRARVNTFLWSFSSELFIVRGESPKPVAGPERNNASVWRRLANIYRLLLRTALVHIPGGGIYIKQTSRAEKNEMRGRSKIFFRRSTWQYLKKIILYSLN